MKVSSGPGTWHKISPMGSSTLIFGISIWLYLQRDERYDSAFTDVVTRYRSAVQIVVSVLASILAWCQISSTRTVLGFSFRLRLGQSPIRLDQISFNVLLLNGLTSLSLPWRYAFVVLLAAVATLAPSALWTGALTPLVVRHLSIESSTIRVLISVHHLLDTGMLSFT